MTILLVEDEPAIRDMVAWALVQDGHAVDQAGLGRDAIERVAAGGIALVVLDVGLPDMSGFEVCRRIRERSGVPVMFLTARSEEIDRVVGLEMGEDYLVKPFSPRELVARVRNLLRRAAPVPVAAPPAQGDFAVDAAGARIRYRAVTLDLTRYEFLLLAALLDAPGRVRSRAQLMDLVWKDAPDTADRTVDTHVKTLRAKLRAVDPSRDPIVTHRGLGYSIDPRG